jgi:hypothetical protein
MQLTSSVQLATSSFNQSAEKSANMGRFMIVVYNVNTVSCALSCRPFLSLREWRCVVSVGISVLTSVGNVDSSSVFAGVQYGAV